MKYANEWMQVSMSASMNEMQWVSKNCLFLFFNKPYFSVLRDVALFWLSKTLRRVSQDVAISEVVRHHEHISVYVAVASSFFWEAAVFSDLVPAPESMEVDIYLVHN